MDDATINDRLLPGERIVWDGRPAQGVMFTARDIFLVPFSLLWCGFAVFWESSVAIIGAKSAGTWVATIPMLLFGGVFVCIGLFFVFGRFFVDAWLRGRFRYALTDQRVLILRSGPFGTFTALSIDRLADSRLSEQRNGRGSIRFGQAQSIFGVGRGGGIWMSSLDPTPQFLAIDDVRRVFDLVQRASGKRA